MESNFYFEQGLQFVITDNIIVDYQLYPFVFNINDISVAIEDTIQIFEENKDLFDENKAVSVKEEIVTTLLVFKNDFKVHIPMSLSLFVTKYNINPHNYNRSTNPESNTDVL